MENSLDETENSCPVKSPPKRRRSTFFVRDSVEPVPQNYVEVSKTNTDMEKRLSDMSRYYEKLLQEKLQWKVEANERRHKYNDLRLQYQMTTKTQNISRSGYAALTSEDIKFINGKPNLTKLIESSKKLHAVTKYNMELVRKVNALEDKTLELTEKRVNKVVKQLIEHSYIESG